MSTPESTRVCRRQESRRNRLRIAAALLALLAATGIGGLARTDATLSDAQQAIAALQFSPGELRIIGEVADGGHAHRPGEPIVLFAQVNRPAYLAVLQVARTGDTVEVWPNREHPGAPLTAGAPLRIVVPQSALPAGIDRRGAVMYEFIAATSGDSWLFHPQFAAGADIASLGPTTRALARDIRAALRRAPGGAAAAFVSVSNEP
jgi:hypothetical protein